MAAFREANDPFLGNDEEEDPLTLPLLVAFVSRLPEPELPPAVMSVPPCRDPLLLPKLVFEPDLECWFSSAPRNGLGRANCSLLSPLLMS